MTASSNSENKSWRCFHCDEVCTDEASAREHFGYLRSCDPICRIDRAEFRRMEKRDIEHSIEDTELHRLIERERADHATKLREAEEAGYARGLADGRALR
jgi:hypothetical protein